MLTARIIASALFALLAASSLVADDKGTWRPRHVIGTQIVFDEPAAPTYLTIMPRVVDVDPPATLPVTVQGFLPTIEPVTQASHTERVQATVEARPETATAPTYIVVPTPMESPPVGAAMLQQATALLGAIVVLLFLVLIACVIVLRRRAPALLQVQVVGAAPHGAMNVPMGMKVVDQNYVPPMPNFDVGPSFEEEARERRAATERQSLAVLSRIADDNLVLRAELGRHLPATEPAV